MKSGKSQSKRKRDRDAVDNVTDSYVRKLMANVDGLKAEHIPDELVDLKRTLIKLDRLIKERSAEGQK